MNEDVQEFYFRDPRLGMTLVGRLLVRVLSYVSYLVLIVATFVLLIADIPWFRGSGVLLGLFLLDRLIHAREGDRPLSELPARGRVNTARYMAPAAFSVLQSAYDKARLLRRNFYLEIVRELLGDKWIAEGLSRLDLAIPEFRSKLDNLLEESGAANVVLSKEERMAQMGTLVEGALRRAHADGHEFVHTDDLFAGAAEIHDPMLERLLSTFSLDTTDLHQALMFTSARRQFARHIPKFLGAIRLESQRGLRHRIMNRAWTSRPTPMLDRFGTDFTDRAREGQAGFLIGHAEEYARLKDTLARPINPNALLVGEAGIGKETLISHLAYEIIKDEVPAALFDKRLVELHLADLVSGAEAGELQARLKAVIEEIIVAGNVILYIPDVHNLVKTSGTAYLSAADALMPVIMNNAFPVVGSTYPREFKEFVEPRSDFTGAFEVIHVGEISEEEAKKILSYESVILEAQTNVVVTFAAIRASVNLAKRYLRNKFLPASAEELLKGAIVSAKRRGEKRLTEEEVIRAAEEKAHVPIHRAGGAEAQALLNLESTIHESFIDQEEAVKAVADALREYRSGLAVSAGPIASFLFVGPTGVGKTELAKTLARVQFGSESAMVRFDMTEYQDKQSFYRFIGSPDGAVKGAMTEAILEKPYSLILLDEFEKAFPDILNLFLQVFDDGRLTDNLDRVVDFKNTILIATSNAHSDLINESLSKGESIANIAEYLKRRLADVFRPELLNRFTRTVIFKDLSVADIKKIAALNLKKVADTLMGQGIMFSFDDAVVEYVARAGYDPAFGARPLRRVIDENIRSVLAQEILKSSLGRGGTVKATMEGDAIKIIRAS